jgi:two-component system, cell cycle response regulator
MPGRILVVDDIPANVRLLEAKLTSEYFDVITAPNGPQALEVARAESPDIVLLDVMMPGMDGFEACRRLKADPRTAHIPVVMVTALSDVADRVRGLEAGADDFLTKPVRDVALFARVRSLVRLKMVMDEWRLRQQTSSELGIVPPAATPEHESVEGARILICEASAIETANLREVLSRDGHALQVASTIAESQRLAASGDLDLVIVDLALGDDEALRLCSHLRAQERTRQTPILLIAEEDQTAKLAKSLDLGVNDYLVQPVDRNELLARVRTQIRRRRFQDRLRASYMQSLSMALTDQLTGLYNRNYLMTHLSGLMQRTLASGKALALAMIDVDTFKQVNDTHGHAAGDEVLAELAQRMTHYTRNFDTVARFGGEEFVVVMPDITPEIAMLVAERLRLRVAETAVTLKGGATLGVTISIGVAVLNRQSDRAEDLLRRADQALYAAKRQGRNRVILADDSAAGAFKPAAEMAGLVERAGKLDARSELI